MATAHVRLSPALRFQAPAAPPGAPSQAVVFYDDCAKALICAAGSQVYVYSCREAYGEAGEADGGGGALEEFAPPTPTLVLFVTAGPVLDARLSPDGDALALRRSANEVEFVARLGASSAGAPREFWQRSSSRILALFWPAGCPACDVALATESGLELYAVEAEGARLRPAGRRAHAGTDAACYTHASRLALLARGRRVRGYQFTAQGLQRVPQFDLVDSDGGEGPQQLEVVTAYGRLYCAHRTPSALCLYRFYRDAVEPQLRVALPAPARALCVADNALVLMLGDGIALVLDAGAAHFEPIAAPLPVGGWDEAPGGMPRLAAPPTNLAVGGWEKAPEAEIPPGDAPADQAAPPSADSGTLYRLDLDLANIAASAADRVEAVAFLQRRRRQPVRARELTLRMLTAMLAEREPLTAVGAALDVVCAAYAAGSRAQAAREDAARAAQRQEGGGAPLQQGPPPQSHHASPEDLVHEVLLPAEDSAAVEPAGLPYVAHAAVELARACRAAGVPCPAEAHLAAARCLLRAGRVDELRRLARSGALGVSPELGRELLRGGGARLRPLALEILQQSAKGEVASALAKAGESPSALRYVREHRVEDVAPAVFLEAAERNGARALASAQKFCASYTRQVV